VEKETDFTGAELDWNKVQWKEHKPPAPKLTAEEALANVYKKVRVFPVIGDQEPQFQHDMIMQKLEFFEKIYDGVMVMAMASAPGCGQCADFQEWSQTLEIKHLLPSHQDSE
jgi:hypothetical protein